MKLDSKVALVTGGSSGIGRAIGRRFLAEGAKVLFVGRRQERLKEAAGSGGAGFTADLRKPEQAERAAAEAVALFGGLHVLVNAAGVIGSDGLLEPRPDEWRRILDSNLETVYHLTRAAVPHLVRHRGSSVLNISSVCSL